MFAVHVKSAFASKINWTQGVAFLAMIMTMFGVDLDASTQAQIVALILAASNVLTWVLRTWFTSTVTPSAVAEEMKDRAAPPPRGR